jgi:hypothetical protein
MKTKLLLVIGLLCLGGLNSNAMCVRRGGPARLGPSYYHRGAAPYACRGYAGRNFYRGYAGRNFYHGYAGRNFYRGPGCSPFIQPCR